MNFPFEPIGSDYTQVFFCQHFCPNVVYVLPVEVPASVPETPNISINKPTSNRRAWSKQEDKRILELIDELDLKSSGKIPYRILARYFPQRTSKQIRERYLNNLDANIIKTPFNSEEDAAILDFYRTNGPRWKRLSRLMPGRTSTSLKNRFNTKLKMRLIGGTDSSGLIKTSLSENPETHFTLSVDSDAKIPGH